MVIYGRRLFGLICFTPGRFFVATEFLHLFFIPVIPIKTWIVTKQTDQAWEGKPTSLSGKSVLLAWFRAALVVAYLAIAVMMFIEIFYWQEARSYLSAAIVAGVSLMCIAVFRWSYRFSMASDTEAALRARELGYSDADAAMITIPPGAAVLGKPGKGLGLALAPLIVWVTSGLLLGRFAFGDRYALLLENLRSGEVLVQSRTFEEIEKLGPENADGLQTFKDYLDDSDGRVRLGAAKALAEVGSGYEDAIPELIKLLADRTPVYYNSSPRWGAIAALGALGPAAKPALDELKKIAADTTVLPGVQGDAKRAVEKIEK